MERKRFNIDKISRSTIWRLKKSREQNENEIQEDNVRKCRTEECLMENVNNISNIAEGLLEAEKENTENQTNKYFLADRLQLCDDNVFNAEALSIGDITLEHIDPTGTTFNNFLSNEQLYTKINQSANTSPAHILLNILEFSIKNKLSLTAICEQISIVNSIFPEPILLESKYMIKKILNCKSKIEYYAFCTGCDKYLGKFGENISSKECEDCHETADLKHLSSLNFFVIIRPLREIESYLSKFENYYYNVVNNRLGRSECIRDIYDGKLYKSFTENLISNETTSYITVMMNTDGAPCFESSQYSIWPIYLIINELPPQERYNCVITCGLWFGRQKPNVKVFLREFVHTMNDLSENGFECNINGKLITLRVFTLLACVDSVARPPMQGLTQFNGKFGCSWCYHEGIHVDGSMRYVRVNPYPRLRNHEDMIQHIGEVLN